jgi:hypothetical protein
LPLTHPKMASLEFPSTNTAIDAVFRLLLRRFSYSGWSYLWMLCVFNQSCEFC